MYENNWNEERYTDTNNEDKNQNNVMQGKNSAKSKKSYNINNNSNNQFSNNTDSNIIFNLVSDYNDQQKKNIKRPVKLLIYTY